MTDPEHGQALAIIGHNEQKASDIQRIVNTIVVAKGMGHEVSIDEWWLSGITKPVPITILTNEYVKTVQAGVLTDEVALSLADIQLGRFQSLSEEHLTPIEQYMRTRSNEVAVPHEKKRLAFSKILRDMGGVAVLGGNNVALRVTLDIYDDRSQQIG